MPIQRTDSDAQALVRVSSPTPSPQSATSRSGSPKPVDALAKASTHDVGVQTDIEMYTLPALAAPAHRDGPYVNIIAGDGGAVFAMSRHHAMQFQPYQAAFGGQFAERDGTLEDTSGTSAEVVHEYFAKALGPYAPVFEKLEFADYIPPAEGTPAMRYVLDHLQDQMQIFVNKFHVATNEDRMRAFELCLRLEKTLPLLRDIEPHKMSTAIARKMREVRNEDNRSDLIKEAAKKDADVLRGLLKADVFSTDKLVNAWINHHYQFQDDGSEAKAADKAELFVNTRAKPDNDEPWGWKYVGEYAAGKLWQDADPSVWMKIYAFTRDDFAALLEMAPKQSTGPMSHASAMRGWAEQKCNACDTAEEILALMPSRDDRSLFAKSLRVYVSKALLVDPRENIKAYVYDLSKGQYGHLLDPLKGSGHMTWNEEQTLLKTWASHQYAKCHDAAQKQTVLSAARDHWELEALVDCLCKDSKIELGIILTSLSSHALDRLLQRASGEQKVELRNLWMKPRYTDDMSVDDKLAKVKDVLDRQNRHGGPSEWYVQALMERIVNDSDPQVPLKMLERFGDSAYELRQVLQTLSSEQRGALFTNRAQSLYNACGSAAAKVTLFSKLAQEPTYCKAIAELIINDSDAALRSEILGCDERALLAMTQRMPAENGARLWADWMAPKYAACADFQAKVAFLKARQSGAAVEALYECMNANPADKTTLLALDAAAFIDIAHHFYGKFQSLYGEWLTQTLARRPDAAARLALIDEVEATGERYIVNRTIDRVFADADNSVWQHLATLDKDRFLPLIHRLVDGGSSQRAQSVLQGWLTTQGGSLDKVAFFKVLREVSKEEREPALQQWVQGRYALCATTADKIELFKNSVKEASGYDYRNENEAIAKQVINLLIDDTAALPELQSSGFLRELFQAYERVNTRDSYGHNSYGSRW